MRERGVAGRTPAIGKVTRGSAIAAEDIRLRAIVRRVSVAPVGV